MMASSSPSPATRSTQPSWRALSKTNWDRFRGGVVLDCITYDIVVGSKVRVRAGVRVRVDLCRLSKTEEAENRGPPGR